MDVGYKEIDDKLTADIKEVRTDVKRLSDKMDAGYKELSDKMDAGYKELSDKMDVGYKELSDKTDKKLTFMLQIIVVGFSGLAFLSAFT